MCLCFQLIQLNEKQYLTHLTFSQVFTVIVQKEHLLSSTSSVCIFVVCVLIRREQIY